MIGTGIDQVIPELLIIIDLLSAPTGVRGTRRGLGNSIATKRVGPQILNPAATAQAGDDLEEFNSALGIETRIGHQADAEAVSLVFVFAGEIDNRLLRTRSATERDRGAGLRVDGSPQ